MTALLRYIRVFSWAKMTPPSRPTASLAPVCSGCQCVLISVFTQAQAWMGYFNRWRHLAVQNLAHYWTFTAVHRLVVAAVVYMSPYVL